ncbi:hypothetical protein [uncultured Marinobacter sp.]|nr:hypothetical protein [uncultured Marinobacter sp.]
MEWTVNDAEGKKMVAAGGLEPLSKPKIHARLRLCVLIGSRKNAQNP